MFKVFYHDYRDAGIQPITSDMNIRMAIRDVTNRMDTILRYPNNFLGIVDAFGKTLQFVVNDNLSITVELVIEERRGSMTGTMPLSEAIVLVADAPHTLDSLTVPDANFQHW